MKWLIQIQFAATLAASLSMGGLARGQYSKVSGEEDREPSPEVTPTSPVASAPADPRSMPPAKAAFFYYFKIQEELAQDSLKNVAANAVALAEVLRKVPAAFPAQAANHATTLAMDAVTLEGARLDFALITAHFMNYLKARNPPDGLGPIHLVYDPTYTRLYWLQTGEPMQNPYLGKYGIPWKPLLPASRPQQPLKLTSS